MENLIKIIFGIISIILFGFFGYLVYEGKNGQGFTLLAILLALLATRMDDLKEISLFGDKGLKANLIKTLKEANATIEQLRSLSVSLAKPIVTSITMSGKIFQYVHLKYKIEHIKGIEDVLLKIGVDKADIHETTKFFFQNLEHEHIKRVIHILKDKLPDGHELKLDRDQIDHQQHTFDKIQHAILDENVDANGELQEYIKDLEFYLEKRELRREDEWQS